MTPDPWDASDGQTQHRDENGNLVGETRADDAALGVLYINVAGNGRGVGGIVLDTFDPTHLALPLSDAAQQARRERVAQELWATTDWDRERTLLAADAVLAALGLGAA